MKKIRYALFLLVAVILLCSLFAVVSSADSSEYDARIGVNFYESIYDAFANAAQGDRIKLLRDVSLTSELSVYKSFSLDLNGNTLTAAEGCYVFKYMASGVNFTVEGEGTIIRDSKVIAVFNNDNSDGDAVFNLDGHFDGITLKSKADGYYFYASSGTFNLSNFYVYSSVGSVSDGKTAYSDFVLRNSAIMNINKLALDETYDGTNIAYPASAAYVFDVHDTAKLTVKDSYVSSPIRGLYLRSNGNTDASREYVRIENSFIKSAVTNPNDWSVSGGELTRSGGKDYSVIIFSEIKDGKVPTGIVNIVDSEFVCLWRFLVSTTGTPPVAVLNNNVVNITRCKITVDYSKSDKLTQKQIDAINDALINSGGNASSLTTNDYWIPMENHIARGCAAKVNIYDSDLNCNSNNYFWTGTEINSADTGYDYYYVASDVRFSMDLTAGAVKKSSNYYMSSDFGDVKNLSVAKVATGDCPYMFAKLGTQLDDYTTGADFFLKYKSGTTVKYDRGSDFQSGIQSGNSSYGAKIESDSLGSKYLKVYVQPGKEYVDEECDSHFLFTGLDSSGTFNELPLFASTGEKNYNYVIIGFDFKTDSVYPLSSELTARFLTQTGGVPSPNFGLTFVSQSGNTTYIQNKSKSFDYYLDSTPGKWHSLNIVLQLSDTKGASGTYAHYFIDGEYLGADKDAFDKYTHYLYSGRYNLGTGTTQPAGASIAFDNFLIRTTDSFTVSALTGNYPGKTLMSASALDDFTSANSGVSGVLKYGTGQSVIFGGSNVDVEQVKSQTLSNFSITDKGDYIKLYMQGLTDAEKKAGKVNINYGQDSYVFIKGLDSKGKELGKTQIYNSTGTTRKFDYVIADIDFMTESLYIGNNSSLSLRFEDANGVLIPVHYNTIRFYATTNSSGKDTMGLITYSQSRNGESGYLFPAGETKVWHHLTMVLDLTDGGYRSADMHFFIDGKYLTTEENTFDLEEITDAAVYMTAFRFTLDDGNETTNRVYNIGDNLCLNNFRFSTYNLPKTVDGDMKTYVESTANKTPIDTSGMGVYSEYVVTDEGKLFGKYYSNVSEALSNAELSHPTLDLIVSEKGTHVSAPVRIKPQIGITFTEFTCSETLGWHYDDSDGVYSFSDTYTSVIGLNRMSQYIGAYSETPTELLWNQAVPVYTGTYSIPSASGDGKMYTPIGWNTSSTVYNTVNIILTPEYDTKLYEVYCEAIYYISDKSGTPTFYSPYAIRFVKDFNSIESGGGCTLISDVLYVGDEQISIKNKTVNLELGGNTLSVLRRSSTEENKHLFRFENTSESEASALNVSSSKPGANIHTGILGNEQAGAIFYMGTDENSSHNEVNVLDSNTTFSSSCVVDIRGKDCSFNAKGGTFVKSYDDYSGLFVIRDGADNSKINIKSADIVSSITDAKILNVLESTGVVNIEKSSLINLSSDSTYSVLLADNFNGTVNLTDIKSNIYLSTPTPTKLLGKINFLGNNYSAVSTNAAGERVYFVEHENVLYNGKTLTNSRFTRADQQLLAKNGINEVSFIRDDDSSEIVKKSGTVDSTLEVITLADGDVGVKWVKYDVSIYSAAPETTVKNLDTLTVEEIGSPFVFPPQIPGLYFFIWKNTGTETPLPLSVEQDGIKLDDPIYVVEMKSKSDFSLKSNLSLSDDFGYNIYVPMTVIKLGTGMTCTIDGKEVTIDTSEESLAENLVDIDDVLYYKIVYSDIAPSRAAAEFKLSFSIPIATTSECHTPKWTYSVPKYADKIFAGSFSEYSCQMVRDMLEYVNCAYIFDGYNEMYKDEYDRLDDSISYAESTEDGKTAYYAGNFDTLYSGIVSEKKKDGEGIGEYFSGVGINLSGSSIKFAFKFKDGVDATVRFAYMQSSGSYKETTVTAANGRLESVNGAPVSESSDIFELEMKVYDFNSDITITVDSNFNGNTYDESDIRTVYNSLSYINYLESLNNSEYENALNLIKALYVYSESADAYQKNK